MGEREGIPGRRRLETATILRRQGYYRAVPAIPKPRRCSIVTSSARPQVGPLKPLLLEQPDR